MRISAKALVPFNSVNSFSQANQWQIRAGEPNTLYFQVVDLDQAALRYIAGIGSSAALVVTFPSIDDAAVISVNAVQSANDGSVWSVALSSTQTPGSGNVQFALTEGTVPTTRRFNVLNMVSVEYPQQEGCDAGLPNIRGSQG